MSNSQEKWNNIYSKQASATKEPQACHLLSQYHYLLPKQGKALDLACGLGGNAVILANNGLDTQAWDISDIAISQLDSQNVDNLYASVRDIESEPMPLNTYDVIVVSHYLHRPLCSSIVEALKPGGLLFYQTFHQDKLTSNGPSNSDFLLKNNELLDLFCHLSPLYYQQLGSQGDVSVGDRNLASLIAEKPY